MSGDPTFAEDAAQYANLAQEIYTDYPVEGEARSTDPVMDLWGGNLEHPPLDQQQFDQGLREQNARHDAAVRQAQAQQYYQAQSAGMPDMDETPVEHFNARMAAMENALGMPSPRQPQRDPRTGVELDERGFPSVQEDPLGHFSARADAAEQSAYENHFWNHVGSSEAQAREQLSDYDEAIKHLEAGRWAELERTFPDAVLRQHGYSNPAAVRLEMLNRDRIGVAQRAIQMGVPPAKLYYDIALQRGWQSTRGPTRDETRHLLQLADRDPETFDRAWDALARRGYL
jgi:hypothetical protein